MRRSMKRAVALGLTFLMTVSAIPPRNVLAEGNANTMVAQLPAFPGAEGGGMYASGGRGYDVYVVTNLEDYGKNDTPIEGSLRKGLESNRTIVFNVAGNIELKESLRFAGLENITIAGQTAPGDGITISGWDTNISNSKNIIIRYVRFRPGAINVHTGGDSMDALWGRDNDTFIIDHCSFSWNTDETLSIYRGENGTVQWNMVYESLTLSGHSKGRHGYGGIAGGDNVTFHHNLYANHTSRNPRLGGGYAGYADADHVAVTELSNNVIYNWGYNTTYGGGYNFANFRNNYELAGPGTRDNVAKWVINPGEATKVGGFYINGNYITDYTDKENGILTDWLDNNSEYVQFSGVLEGADKTEFSEVPYVSANSTGVNSGKTNVGFDSYELRDAKSVLNEVVEKAGATYPRRDALDARIAAEVENGLGRYINTEHQIGGYVSPSGVITARRDADFDKDCDGMADEWELSNGLNPNDASDRNGTTLSVEGYTNLEVYLNSLVDMEHIAENPTATIVSPVNNEYVNEGDAVTVSVDVKSEYGHAIDKVDFYYSTEYETVFVGTVDVAGNVATGSAISGEISEIPAVVTGGSATDVVSGGAIGGVTEGTFSKEITGLKDGSYYITARVYDVKGNQTQTTASEIHVNRDSSTLADAGWMNQDIGNVAINGTGSFVDGVLTVKGNGKLGKSEGSVSGTDTSRATKDEFHYVYQEVTGDVEVVAKMESMSAVDNHAFAGIMIRNGLAEDSATAALGLSWVKYTNLPWSMYLAGRDTDGGNFNDISETIDSQANAEKAGISLQADIPFKNGKEFVGYWMKLSRFGDKFTAYSSSDGEIWTKIGERTIKMNEKVYVGFAADSNKVANDIEQLNTARFSNIKINTTIYDVTYNLTDLKVEEAPTKVADGEDLFLKLTTEFGMQVPETIQVTINNETKEVPVEILDKLEGKVVIQNVSGDVTITAAGVEDNASVKQVTLTEKDDLDLLNVTWKNKAMILDQTATKGQMTQNVGVGSEKLAENVSYLLFPETSDAQKMELDITILSKTDEATSKGVFVGAFDADSEAFLSLGFRNTTKQSLTGYWSKANGLSGNGSSAVNNGSANTKPSYKLGEKYHVVFEKVTIGLNQQYKVTYTGIDENGNAMDAYKLFKDSEDYLKADETSQYGLALIGVSAQVENLTLTDSRNRVIYDQNAKILPEVVDENGLLKVSEVGTTIVLDQTATTGRMTKSANEQAENISYYVFPETSNYQTMSLDLTISDYYITGQAGKTAGVFVGGFQLESPQNFLSLGFRGYEASVGTDSLSGYWTKGTGVAGNGSPKYAVEKNVVYNVTFEKTEKDGYWAYFTNTSTGVTDKKQFKQSEIILTPQDSLSFGIALVGAKAEVKNLKLVDANGTVIYDQNDHVSEAGKAPVVTKITSAQVNDDRTAIDLTWTGEGAEGDGRYVVEVSKNGGNYIRIKDTTETTISYPVDGSGSYVFKVYGICGQETTEAVVSEAVVYKAPITAPGNIYASNDGGVLTVRWDKVEEADSYEVYRSTSKDGEYTKLNTTTETSYVDDNFDFEQPYYYYVISLGDNNSSNPSNKVFIMASKGHTGDYVYGKEAPSIEITQKPNDTVTSGEVVLAGKVDTNSTVSLVLNGEVVKTSSEVFDFAISLEQGRNDIELIVKAEDGRATRKTFNFVYLTSYDILVDGSYEGTDGELVDNVPVYKTLEAALNAADENGTLIYIKNGRYYEKLTINKKNISLIGEDSEKTVLYYDVASGSKDSEGKDYGTSGSASITINASASNFSAENLTISNEFDYVKAVAEKFVGTQAVALLNKSDGSVFTNVRMYGYQDTLCAHSNSQYYYKCYIAGNVDYIFGGAKAVFEDSDLVNLLPGYVTAASTEAAQEYGYVFINSRVLGAKDLGAETVYLARPWRADAAVTYIDCYLEDVVRKIGYSDMSTNSYKNARFFEYNSYGPGFAVNSDRIQLSKEEVAEYTKSNIFGAFDVDARYAEISGLYEGKTETPEPTVAPTAIPTETPEPTVTPDPTVTPEPTSTPKPTSTPSTGSDSDNESTVSPTPQPEKVEIVSVDKNETVQSILKKDKNNSTAIIAAVTGGEKGKISVSVDVSSNKELKSGERVYVFRVDSKTGKLLSIPGGYGYKVSANGKVDLILATEGEYVILENAPSNSVIRSIPAQVWSSMDYSVLYLDGEIGATREFKLHLPETVEIVNSLNEKPSSKAMTVAKVEYSSSNTAVATVSKDGVITAKSNGKAVVVTKVTFVSGKVKIMKRTIVVKEPSVRFNIAKTVLKVNETIDYSVKGLGYPTNKIEVSIQNNGVLELVDGKIRAVKAGSAVVTAKYGDVTVTTEITVK